MWKDVAIGRQSRVVDWRGDARDRADAVAANATVEDDVHEVADAEHSRRTSKTSSTASRPSSAARMPRCCASMPLRDLEADDRREACARATPLSMMREQIVGALLRGLGVRVAGHPEVGDRRRSPSPGRGCRGCRRCTVFDADARSVARRSGRRMKRLVPAPTGTFTRASASLCSPSDSAVVTSRLSERFEMKGKGCAGSVACGVTSG